MCRIVVVLTCNILQASDVDGPILGRISDATAPTVPEETQCLLDKVLPASNSATSVSTEDSPLRDEECGVSTNSPRQISDSSSSVTTEFKGDQSKATSVSTEKPPLTDSDEECRVPANSPQQVLDSSSVTTDFKCYKGDQSKPLLVSTEKSLLEDKESTNPPQQEPGYTSLDTTESKCYEGEQPCFHAWFILHNICYLFLSLFTIRGPSDSHQVEG